MKMNTRPDVADHPARILIVDDDGNDRQLLEIALAREGFFLMTAASGEEALAMVAQQPPDLILLDAMMPRMDGYQVAGKIKGDLGTKNIPVIMLTGLGDRIARMHGLSAGAEDFLTKPVDRAELCVRVRNLLRLKFYGDYYDKYSQTLEGEVKLRTAELVERTKTLEQQAALLDLAPDAIVAQDMQCRILFWNRGAEIMYGWLSKEALGRISHELLKTEFSQPIENIETTLLREGQWEGETIHQKCDGTHVTVASRWALQRDAGGAPVQILTIHNDITERKEAGQALEQSRKDQLRFKDEFLSHVSHELRSPLTAIKQFTSILLGGLAGELNKEQRQYEEIVQKNIGQLQSMIDDLLEVTRLETGKLTVEPEVLAIASAVSDIVNIFEGTARAKGVPLSCDLAPDLPKAHADRTRLQQILIILLDNAIKFTPDGGMVTIQARLFEQDPRFVLLAVSDTGCGIAQEIAEKIFDRLYQVEGGQYASRKGLGLGLYICKELVTRQGGQIWVKSEETGCTFSFTLPVFSLNNVIAPLLRNGKWPAQSVALVKVENRLRGAWPSKETHEEWSHEARSLLERCLLPDVAVLLPQMSPGAEMERFFVAAFADEKGASILANRIRQQFEHLPHLEQTGLTVSVSYSMLAPVPCDVGASVENILASMATSLEASIKSHITSEVDHE